MFGKAHNDEQNQHQFNIWKSFSLLKSLPWKELVANTMLHEFTEAELFLCYQIINYVVKVS